MYVLETMNFSPNDLEKAFIEIEITSHGMIIAIESIITLLYFTIITYC